MAALQAATMKRLGELAHGGADAVVYGLRVGEDVVVQHYAAKVMCVHDWADQRCSGCT